MSIERTGWLIVLPDTADHTVLSADEERRAGSFLRATAAATYVRVRCAIRTVLGRELGEAASDVRIAATPGGAPVLPDHPDVCVSWSTTTGVLLLGVSRGARIGVDVETLRPIRSPARVLRTFYPGVQALGEFGEPETFFSAWTLLEAAVKATGRGLARGAREVRLYRPPGADRCALAGISDAAGDAWSGRTDRFSVPGSGAEVMTAVVTEGAADAADGDGPIRLHVWESVLGAVA
jgi:4'-phosphopantetheinyl transferase